jgi:hypothetical protein
MKDEFSEVTERAIQDVIPVWLEHMRKSLTQVDIGQAFAENPEHAWQLLKVRYSIFKVRSRDLPSNDAHLFRAIDSYPDRSSLW